MALKIYIFIFLVLNFGLIESLEGSCGQVRTPDTRAFPGQFHIGIDSPIRLAHLFKKEGSAISSGQQHAGEVVINEIMADPTPVVALPDREYLELFNNRSAEVNLKGWLLVLGAKIKIFPDVTVSPGGYLLITSPGGSKDLQQFGKVIEISGFVLNNEGLSISLQDPEKRVVDQFDYSPSLQTKGFENGGFSMERIDPDRLCGQRDNWSTTLSPLGGTPGIENSVRASNPDNTPPQLLSTIFADNSRLDILLSERFLFSDQQVEALRKVVSGVVIDSVKTDPNSCLLRIYFRPSTVRNGENYSLTLHGVSDECGNIMPDKQINFGYYLPLKSDLLISEVLFNPFQGGADFVEIYNNSGHQVDLSELYLATRDASANLKQISQISVDQKYMPAGSYLAVTRSMEGVLRFYTTLCLDCLLQMEKFPTLNDQSGCVVLLDKNRDVIDEMGYNDAMHHPLISNTEGISLERISFSEPASGKENWHSASKSCGFATPGYENSVLAEVNSSEKVVSVDPKIFSPNGDGINDQLNIYINTGDPGWILNITILNCAGYIVRNLANNYQTGSSDHLYWDGKGDEYQNVMPGIYILNISLFNPSGKRLEKRYACVLTDHL